MIKLTSILQDTLLYEGLIHSQSIDTVEDMLSNWSIAGSKLQINKRSNNSIRIYFIKHLKTDELKNLIQLINNLGWFVASYSVFDNSYTSKQYDYDQLIQDIKMYGLEWIRLEAKYDLELNKYELSDLYHVSPEKYQEKIQKIGLVPKSQEKRAHHPERIYFTKNEGDAEFLAKQFNEFYEGNYNLYKIDIDKLRRKNNGIRFFNDPAYTKQGIYTLSNVPPDCITLIRKIQPYD
jgi:hypothetical protein